MGITVLVILIASFLLARFRCPTRPLLTVVLMLLFLGEKTESVGIFGGILCLLQIVPLLVSIFVVEKKLQAAFDENGVRRR